MCNTQHVNMYVGGSNEVLVELRPRYVGQDLVIEVTLNTPMGDEISTEVRWDRTTLQEQIPFP